MLVALIIAVLAAAAVPRLSRTASRLRAEQAAFELMQWLRVAHEQAVAEGHTVTWMWDDHTRRAAIEPSGLTSGSLPGALAVEVTRRGQPVDCQCVVFFPSGTSEPTTLTIGSYTLTVDEATSHVQLRAGAAAR